MNEWNETETEGTTEWMQNFYAGEECNLPGLAYFAAFNMSCGLHRQPPTPTGAASGHAGWIRLTANMPPTANKGAMPLPLPAANKDLGRKYEANKA